MAADVHAVTIRLQLVGQPPHEQTFLIPLENRRVSKLTSDAVALSIPLPTGETFEAQATLGLEFDPPLITRRALRDIDLEVRETLDDDQLAGLDALAGDDQEDDER